MSACSDPIQKIRPNQTIVSITEGGFRKSDSSHAYEIDLKYPVIDANIAPDILTTINNSIPEKFNSFIDQKAFIEAHLNLPEDFYSDNTDWKGLLTNTYKVHQADSLLFLTFSVYQYFVGAAHGSTSHYSLRFDLSSGNAVSISDLIETDRTSLTSLRNLFNAHLPDSICWGIQSDSSTLANIKNIVLIPDSVIFYVDDYSLCPNAFSSSDVRFSNAQISAVLKKQEFNSFSEIETAMDEGEIATH